MTSNNPAERKTESRKGTKMEKKSKIETKNNKKMIKNSTSKDGSRNDDDEPEVKIAPSSSPEHRIKDEEEEEEEEEDDELDIEDVDGEEITNQRSDKSKEDLKKKKKKKDESENVLYTFPMNRINRIIKAEDSDIRVTQEAVFLINKASEKFLELFCKEAYACSVLEHKNFVGYQHLSSVVGKRRRFDFLSDFVPEKVKAEDALAEATPAET